MNILSPSVRLNEDIEIPARRCPDYDDECKDVLDHVSCFAGGTYFVKGTIWIISVADGYCPFLVGQEQRGHQ